MGGEASLQIGEVAERVGLSLRTVRYYEEVGLIEPSDRTAGGFRLYTDDDVARLELIKQVKPLGFTLDELRALLEVRRRLRFEELSSDEREEALGELVRYLEDAKDKAELLRANLEAAESFVTKLEDEVASHRRSAEAGRR